jgi:hypothetical protein
LGKCRWIEPAFLEIENDILVFQKKSSCGQRMATKC